MCANYTPTHPDRLRVFGAQTLTDTPYKTEVFPGDAAPIWIGGLDERIEIATFGMIPSWAEPKLARSTYNARSETVAQKPSFRHAWREGQFCVIPADVLYEPCYESGKAERFGLTRDDGAPMGLAGLWEARVEADTGKTRYSFTMLTINADAHPLIRRLHRPEEEKRMMVVLDPADYQRWLHATPAIARTLLQPYPAHALRLAVAPRRPTAGSSESLSLF